MTASTPDAIPAELPTDIGWGWLDWRLMFFDGDGGDADDAPDLIPAAGAIVTATPNVQLASHLTGTTFTAGKRAIHGIIDTQGRLCRKNSASGMPEATPGLPVIATDSAALTSQGFAYEITVAHPALTIGKFSTQVSAGERVDLAKRIGQSAPPGTQVAVLTPEIRAEIARAVASVTPTLPDDLVTADDLKQALAGVKVDTSGLATTDALQQVQTELGTKVDEGVLVDLATKTELAGLATPEQIAKAIADNNLKLEEGDRTVGVAAEVVADKTVLTLTTAYGREIAVPLPAAAGLTRALWRLSWDHMQGQGSGAWLSREGGVCALRMDNPRFDRGLVFFTPPVGFQPAVLATEEPALLVATITGRAQVVADTIVTPSAIAEGQIIGTARWYRPSVGDPWSLAAEIDGAWMNKDAGGDDLRTEFKSAAFQWVTNDATAPDPAAFTGSAGGKVAAVALGGKA